MDIRQWWLSIHPLDYLRLSQKEISPMEQRDYLYRQEMALEKSYRTQQDFNQAFSEYRQIQEAKIFAVLDQTRNQSTYNSSMIQWMENIWHYLWNVDSWIRDLGSKINLNTQVTIEGIKYLAWELWNLWQITQNWFSEMISWIRGLSNIVYDVHSELQKLNLNISNPEKVLLLERKRDWFEYYKNWWIEESLERLDKALEVIWTDYDIHFLKWIIYLEEFKDYEKAKNSFIKASIYAKPYNTDLYIASLNKLALTQYIIWDFEHAFKNQMEVISTSEKEELDISANCYFDLARYSAITCNQEIFEKAVFECLNRNKSFIVKFLSDDNFKDEWKQKLITIILSKIKKNEIITWYNDQINKIKTKICDIKTNKIIYKNITNLLDNYYSKNYDDGENWKIYLCNRIGYISRIIDFDSSFKQFVINNKWPDNLFSAIRDSYMNLIVLITLYWSLSKCDKTPFIEWYSSYPFLSFYRYLWWDFSDDIYIETKNECKNKNIEFEEELMILRKLELYINERKGKELPYKEWIWYYFVKNVLWLLKHILANKSKFVFKHDYDIIENNIENNLQNIICEKIRKNDKTIYILKIWEKYNYICVEKFVINIREFEINIPWAGNIYIDYPYFNNYNWWYDNIDEVKNLI